MLLNFRITNQLIQRTDRNIVVADSKNYLQASFTFTEQNTRPSTILFYHDTLSSPIKVIYEATDEYCFVPPEVIKAPGFSVSLFYGDLVTINTASVPVEVSGLADGVTVEPPTPDVYAQLLEKVVSANDTSKSALDLANDTQSAAATNAESARAASLVAIAKEYETSQDAASTEQDKQSVLGLHGEVSSMTEEVRRIEYEVVTLKGQPNGVATLDINSEVIETAKNSKQLAGKDPGYYATKQDVEDTNNLVYDRVRDIGFTQDTSELSLTKHNLLGDQVETRKVVGLLKSVTEDTNTGLVSFNFYDGSYVQWNKGRDNFLSSASLDGSEIVMEFVSGQTLRVDLSKFVDVNVGSTTDSVKTEVVDKVISATVVISTRTGNRLSLIPISELSTDQGLYVEPTDLSNYYNKAEADNRYLGINDTAKNSEKVYGKAESELSVNHSDSADKFSTPIILAFNGAASGNGEIDGTGNVNITLNHNTLAPELATIVDNDYTLDCSTIDYVVINNSTPVSLTLSNIPVGYYGIVIVYGGKLNEEFLASQGFVLKAPYTYIETDSIADPYTYIFSWDGVAKRVTRSV